MFRGSGINMADLYGGTPVTPRGEPTSTAAANGQLSALPAAPAISWLGIVLALIVLRVLYELAPSAAPGG